MRQKNICAFSNRRDLFPGIGVYIFRVNDTIGGIRKIPPDR